MTLTEFRACFPAHQRGIHLNHAGMGPIPQQTVEAVRAVAEDIALGDGNRSFIAHLKRQKRLREALAAMMQVPVEGVAFVRNTSHGLAIAAQAIPFQPGENVVVASSEYPSVVYPWQAQAYRGVETRLVEPRDDGSVAEGDLEAACDSATRVLAVSWVQWGTGQVMDLERLGTFCERRGIWFVVDVIQGLGSLVCELTRWKADIAAGGCHKWLLAPAGIGPLFVRPDRLGELVPTNVGWNWVDDPLNWDRLRFDDVKPAAERYEEGSPGILATVGLASSVDLLHEVGMTTVADAVQARAAWLRSALRDRGMVVCPVPTASGIVPFRHPRLSNEQVLETLTASSVWAAIRCGWVRLSPHAYTTEDELASVLALLSHEATPFASAAAPR